ncbi:MAG: 4Fe-4S dicluster domain-containing protein [Bacteroidota bacterium]
MNKTNESLSLANPAPIGMSVKQKIGLGLGFTGLLISILPLFNVNFSGIAIWLSISLLLIVVGTLIYANAMYLKHPRGIKNNGVWFRSLTSRKGIVGWLTGIGLTVFYVLLYWFPEYLGLNAEGENGGIIALFDPLSRILSGNPASQWFVYGTLYTIAILIFGYKFILKYHHNKYQIIRTLSVMFFQLAFAFLIPEFMARLNYPYYDLKNMWPLNYYFFYDYNIKGFLNSGTIGALMLVFGSASIFVISPILTYFYGKRWYCSWVCGCGGMAETAGDPFRHLSSKKLSAWKLERWLIHLILVFAVVMTIAVIYSFLGKNPDMSIISRSQFVWGLVIFLSALLGIILYFKRKELKKDARYAAIAILSIILITLLMSYFSDGRKLFFISAYELRKTYGFLIGAAFSGVIGVGFYPLLGNRIWCRFGCPMAAILGIQQRLFSRFRITTNGGQCISCGNCSTYCEMGIDVRAYAQKGQNIVRASCVGCGICSAVCPRGVLKLENGKPSNRIKHDTVLLGNDVDLLSQLKQQ